MLLSFILSVKSINAQYVGSLACWTVCAAPVGTGIDIVLHAVVNKNKAENTSNEGDGIRYRQLLNEQESEPTI